MTKNTFLNTLRDKLAGLPKDDLDSRINFYDEMIEDRMAEGIDEEVAVEDIGTIDEIVNEIAKETPLTKLVKEKVKPKRRVRVWEIILLVLGFPLWFPLALTAIILAFVAYLLIWILVIVTYAVELSFIAGAIGGLVLAFINLAGGGSNVVLLFGMSIMCAGGAILLFFGCVGATKLTIQLSGKIMTAIKRAFIKKGRN